MIRLKGPRQSNPNPLDGLRVQPLNYMHNSTSPTTIKRKNTIPARMSCYLWSHVKMAAVSLLIKRDKGCRGFKLLTLATLKMVIPRTAGSCSTNDSTGWKLKKGQQFTLLRRITKLKFVNSDIVLLSTVSLERLSPKGSYHLDGTGMSDTLAQKHLIELLKWNASHVHKQPSKSDRHVWKS